VACGKLPEDTKWDHLKLLRWRGHVVTYIGHTVQTPAAFWRNETDSAPVEPQGAERVLGRAGRRWGGTWSPRGRGVLSVTRWSGRIFGGDLYLLENFKNETRLRRVSLGVVSSLSLSSSFSPLSSPLPPSPLFPLLRWAGISSAGISSISRTLLTRACCKHPLGIQSYCCLGTPVATS